MSSTSSIKPHHRPSLNPWEALFSSVTRPRTAVVATAAAASGASAATEDNIIDVTNANARGGYTILIQHSMTPSSQRQWAVTSSTTTIAGDNKKYFNKSLAKDKPNYSSSSSSSSIIGSGSLLTRDTRAAAAAAPPPPAHWNDSMSGPMVVQQAFEELCHRCNGAVVFVSSLGTKGGNNFIDLETLDQYTTTCQTDDGDGGGADMHGDHTICQSMNNLQLSRIRNKRELLQTFHTNGAWVDLSSNPFGWDEEDNTDTSKDHNSDIDDEDTISSNNSLFVHRSTIQKLLPIVRTIQKAVASIEDRRRRRHHQSLTKTTTKLPQQQQSIPIVFDSLTPLLQFHGVEKTIVMLKCLRSGVGVPLSIAPSRSIAGGSSSSITLPPLPPTTITTSILSPIIAPVLYESLRPSEHRNLEDISDAMIHLKLNLDISEYHASTTMTTTTSLPSSLTDQYTNIAVIPAVMDLVRRGGGGGSGGKLIRHCIPLRIMRSSSLDSTKNKINCPLKEDWHWEILDHDEIHGKNVVPAVAKGETLQINQLINADEQKSQTSSTKSMSRPRIYLQDDDPDNDFHDEEADYDYG